VAFVLWPDDDENAALSNLRRHVALLENALPRVGGPWLRKDRTTIQWAADPRGMIDVVRYEALSTKPEDYAEAVELYRGEFLETADDEWVVARRDQLRGRQMEMLQHLAETLRSSGAFERSLAYAQQAYRLDPWCEDSLRVVMGLRRALGDVSGALGEYRTFKERIREELGVEPAPETIAARAELTGRIGDKNGHTDAVTPIDEPPSNLPANLASFVGRESDVSEIASLLSRHRLVTLTGSGGIGKTRTSVQVGASLRGGWKDGIWFLELAALSDSALISTTIASALGVRLSPDGDPVDALVAALRFQHALLILDNCEHVVEGAAAIASALLHGCANITILTTSRRALRIGGEAIYRLDPLKFPPESEIGSLRADDARLYDAVMLFADRSAAVDRRFRLTDENAPTIGNIVRRLDGIPLALELAAARIDTLGLLQLRNRLDERFRLLSHGSRDALPRQQTLEATIDWSYDLLEERERALFRRVAIFVGGFTPEAAGAICANEDLDQEEIVDVLASLAEKSLVIADTTQSVTRYRLLETAREYAVGKLAPREREQLAARHLAHFSNLCKRSDEEWQASGTLEPVSALSSEVENLRAAMSWALTHGDTIEGAVIALSTRFVWSRLDLDVEATVNLHRFVAALPEAESGLLARLWAAISMASVNVVNTFRGAFDAAQRSLDYARSVDDVAALIESLIVYAYSAARSRRLDLADSALGELEALPKHLKTPRQLLRLLQVRGYVAWLRSDFEAAIGASEALRTLYGSQGDLYGEAYTVANLAEVKHALGDTDGAIALLKELLPATTLPVHRELRVRLLSNFAAYLLAAGDVTEARAAAREGIALLATVNPGHGHITSALEHTALALALDGQLTRAARLLGYCDAAFRKVGFNREFTEQTTNNRLTQILRERQTKTDLARLQAEGTGYTPQRAIAEALR
jgi:predicted ATPase/DNA-binding SARP family transcriptional activator